VIYDFINKLKKNPKQLEILGDGNQTKHYILVEDLLDAIIFVLKNSKEQINYYNITNDTPLDVNSIAKIVIAEMGLKNVKITHTDGRQGWKGDVPLSFLSPKKINKLGWKAKYDSSEAVRRTVRILLGKK
jgi:UDP-glucose 4-epimerase